MKYGVHLPSTPSPLPSKSYFSPTKDILNNCFWSQIASFSLDFHLNSSLDLIPVSRVKSNNFNFILENNNLLSGLVLDQVIQSSLLNMNEHVDTGALAKNIQSSLHVESTSGVLAKNIQPSSSSTPTVTPSSNLISQPSSINPSSSSIINKIKPHSLNLSSIKQSISSLSPAQKKLLFNHKREINTRVGQIQASNSKIMSISSIINQILNSVKQDSLLYPLVLSTTTKSLVKQAENEVAVKPNLASSLALLTQLLIQQHLQLLGLLVARLYKKCPFTIPYYVQMTNKSTFAKECGYKVNEDGVIEKEIIYIERMCGIVSYYAALSALNILPGWEWISRLLNMPPRNITASLLMSFLYVYGHCFLKTYEIQARKVLHFVYKDYIPLCLKRDMASGKRLELWLEKGFIKDGCIKDVHKIAV